MNKEAFPFCYLIQMVYGAVGIEKVLSPECVKWLLQITNTIVVNWPHSVQIRNLTQSSLSGLFDQIYVERRQYVNVSELKNLILHN